MSHPQGRGRGPLERAVCPVCRRDVAAWHPKGGDGMDVRLLYHKTLNSRNERIYCAGSGHLAGELKAAGVSNP